MDLQFHCLELERTSENFPFKFTVNNLKGEVKREHCVSRRDSVRRCTTFRYIDKQTDVDGV